MTRLITIFLLCTLHLSTSAQTLRGIVLNRSDDSKPAVGVQLTPLTGGDNPRSTNSAGIFEFKMPNVRPGQPIELIVQYADHVLLGPDETIHRLRMPEENDTAPVRLVVVEKAALKNLEGKYVEGIEKQLQRAENERAQLVEQLSIDTLNQDERLVLSQTISKQSQEIEELRKNKEQLAQKLAQIDLDEASEFARQALQKFQEEGDLDAALELISLENVEAFWENVLTQEEKVARAREQGVENFMIRARILLAVPNYAEAKVAYLAAIARDTNDLDNVFEGAKFLQDQNDFQTAIKLYESLLIKDLSVAFEATVLNNLGNLYGANQRMGEAESAYDEALESYRELAGSNPSVYLPDVASTLNNLGVLYSANQRMGEAESAYDEALESYRELAGSNPSVYLPYVAGTLNNLGVLKIATGEYSEAKEYYIESLSIRLDAIENEQLHYASELGRVLRNLSNVRDSLQIRDKHQEAYQIAVFFPSTWERLLFIDTAQIKIQLAQEYGGLSWYALFAQKYPEAETAAQKGLAHDPTQQWINTNLALALLFQNKRQEAEQLYRQYKDQPYPNDETKTWRDIFLADLAELAKAGIEPKRKKEVHQWLE